MEKFKKTVISRIDTVGDLAYLISFPSAGEFQAGQVVGVTTGAGIAPRLYSLASGESEALMDIFFNVQTAGELSPNLARLKAGDELMVSEPHGSFTSDGSDCWWIATGTGVAPFRSMYRSGIRPTKMIQGGRTFSDLYFEEEFNGIENYVKCLTQEAHTDALHMRLTLYLEQLETLPDNLKFYLCGSTNMVIDVRDLLIRKGVPFEKIVTEIYF